MKCLKQGGKPTANPLEKVQEGGPEGEGGENIQLSYKYQKKMSNKRKDVQMTRELRKERETRRGRCRESNTSSNGCGMGE
jgi:hypothetical protein